jgi:hypothetical protein
MRRTPFDRSMRLYPINPFQMAVTPASCSAALGPLKYSSTAALTGFTEDRISRVTAFSTGFPPLASDCLSGNTILILTTDRVPVGVGVNVFVGVSVREGVVVIVAVEVKVAVDVGLSVAVLLGVCEGVTVAVAEGLDVDVDVDVDVGMDVGVLLGVRDGVTVTVAEGLGVGVDDGTRVCVAVLITVGVAVAASLESRQAGIESLLPYGFWVLLCSS